MNDFELSYREVIPDQTNAQIRKDITINTGAAQSTLQDIKVIEKAGGYCYSDLSHESKRNRFIYWRTNGDVLELSEISLDLNLTDNAVRYKFTDAPILAVSIAESNDHIIVLVATVSSLHQLKFSQPREFQKIHDETQSYSVFHGVCTGQTVRDANTSLVYVINQLSASNQPIPHTASCTLSENGREAYFALAYQSNMILYTMNCLNGQVGFVELKESYRILTNLTGAFRGKNPDSQYVTSMVFGTCKFGAIDDTVFLYGLYRDDHMRMWSVKTGQCVSIVNCVPNALETRTRGSRNNLLRKAAPDMLCAFLCSAKGSEFVTIRVSSDGTSIVLQQISVIPSPEFDLIEFDVNYKRIWGLWCNSQGEYNVSSYSLVSNGDYSWSSAGLEILPERKIEPGSDPRQAYCSYIFYPGRFQREVIDRALVMFRRSNVLSDPNVPLTALKDRVCYAVEQEVQNELKEFDVTDDVYIETSFKAWERFYSCCEQYHIKATQPIGLVNLDSIGAVTVIKKNAFSLLRPCELLEHLMLLGENVECLTGLGLDDENITEDLIKLITTLSTLEQNISDESKAEIDTKLYELNTPNELISQLLSDYEHNFIDPELRDSINSEMKFISQLPNAMTMLLKLLQMNDAETDDMQTSFPNILHTSRGLLSIGHLFRSDTGISLVSESLHQIAVIRYALCRNLLILQQILIDSSDLPIDTLEYIRSDCMPETVVFVQAYYVMVWICETSETPPTTGNLDASIQKLSTLQLSDCRYKSRPNHPTTLLEQFLRGKGLEAGVWMLLQDQCRDINDIQWKNTLLPLATIVGQLLWAVDGNFIFGEWLIGSCQHILIQEYVRLLNSWCEWNKYSRHFIAAVSLLDDGEPYKAFDLFMQCAKGVQQEAFLVKVILQSAEDLTQSESVTQYYLRVIQLFEQYSSQDCVISLAKAAIDELDPSSPQLAMFQSIVFANHLSLEHYEEAYHSLIANTEPSRRKDCLRQLVVCLFEKQRLDLLMKFPYLGLQEELEAIIESRARSMAIENNIYYDFLYAFYISKSTMRKAASVMYEQALRCQLETKTLSGLEHRYECLLACVTALSLADEDYRWIARPVISDEIPDEHDENDMETDEVATKQKVVVCELAEIRKELLLTDAIITLAKHRKELSTIVNATPDDVIAVLSNAGLYTDAVKLAVKFEKSIANILQGLAFACVRANDESSNDSWAWLQENDLADIPQKNSPSDMAWKLLQRLIHDYEEDGLTTLHKAVTNKLLALGEFLPHWLFLSYREKNASELLNLYVTHGRLVEATSLAKEYIAAMTNTGSEYFGLKNCMQSTLPPLCFPVNTIDSLLHNLKLNSEEDVEYAQCHNELSDVVNNYLSTAERISIDKIQYLAANAAR